MPSRRLSHIREGYVPPLRMCGVTHSSPVSTHICALERDHSESRHEAVTSEGTVVYSWRSATPSGDDEFRNLLRRYRDDSREWQEMCHVLPKDRVKCPRCNFASCFFYGGDGWKVENMPPDWLERALSLRLVIPPENEARDVVTDRVLNGQDVSFLSYAFMSNTERSTCFMDHSRLTEKGTCPICRVEVKYILSMEDMISLLYPLVQSNWDTKTDSMCCGFIDDVLDLNSGERTGTLGAAILRRLGVPSPPPWHRFFQHDRFGTTYLESLGYVMEPDVDVVLRNVIAHSMNGELWGNSIKRQLDRSFFSEESYDE